MLSLLVILFGVVKQFCRFWIWSETECKTPAEYGYSTIQHPPSPPFSLERGGEVREKVDRQQ